MKRLFFLLLLPVLASAQTKTPIQNLYDVVHDWTNQSNNFDQELRFHQHHVWIEPDGSVCKSSCSALRDMTNAEYLAAISKRDTAKEAVAVKMRARAVAPIAQHCKAHSACKAVPHGKYGIEDLKGFIATHEREK